MFKLKATSLRDLLLAPPSFDDLVHEKHSEPTEVSGQVDLKRVNKNIALFHDVFLQGSKLYALYKDGSVSEDKSKHMNFLIADILDTLSNFGSDGGILRNSQVREDIVVILRALTMLQNFIQQGRRELAYQEITRDIPEFLFLIMMKLVEIADGFCKTMFSTKGRNFYSTIQKLPSTEQICILKFITEQLPAALKTDYNKDLILRFVTPYNKEMYYHLLPRYIEIFESNALPLDKMHCLKVIWIELYEAIASGCGLLSSDEKSKERLVRPISNPPFSIFRHLFVHAIEHKALGKKFEEFMRGEEQQFLSLGLELLMLLQNTDSANSQKMDRFITNTNELCRSFAKTLDFPVKLEGDFSKELSSRELSDGDSCSSKYILDKINILYSDFESVFSQLKKEHFVALIRHRFLDLSTELQITYLKLVSFVQDFGICFGTILKHPVFNVVNDVAKDVGSLDELDYKLSFIRDIGIDCIVARNKSVHYNSAKASDIINLCYRINQEGSEAIKFLTDIVNELNQGEHLSQQFKRVV
jgi:hypothetical protein